MKNNKYLNIFAGLAFLGFATACEPEIDRDEPSYEQARGEADFKTYVALGNSLTAGYADGALNQIGQINSYPAIIANKLDVITPNFTFEQPLLPVGTANGTLTFGGVVNGSPVLAPVTNGLGTTQLFAKVSGTFNNLAVPGAKVGDLTNQSFANPYFQRFATEGKSAADMAADLNPTFFTLWIGNNDVLGFATEGGQYRNTEGNVVGPTITSASEFETAYKNIVEKLKASNANIEGALANIPDIANIPFFNVVPWNAFVLESQAQVDLLNASFTRQIRDKIIEGVVTEGARRQIIGIVAQEVVYQQAYAQAKQAGASDADADQAAKDYVQSTEGQAKIADLKESLINKKQPAEVHNIVEQQLASPSVKQSIAENTAGAQEADKAGNLAAALGTEGAAAVETQVTLLKAGKYFPQFQMGPNGFVVASEQSPTGFKQLTKDEKMTIKFLTRTTAEFDPSQGKVIVPDKYALDQFELAQVNGAITAYNNIIASVATANTFALVDVNAFFDDIVDGGMTVDGISLTADFIRGNTFSLDGVHLTQIGYAVVAKKFIETINSYYKSSIPLPNIRNYPGVALPAPVAQ